jgi:tetratricopeptide (TPR) repeat protein
MARRRIAMLRNETVNLIWLGAAVDHTMTMRRQRLILFAVVVALATVWVGGPAGADQTDQRLDGLFAQLRAAESAEIAQPIEAEIWAIWTEANNPAADRLMIEGVVAMNAGQYDLALKTFGHLVEIAPHFAEGWNKRATVLFLVGRYVDSVRDIDKVLALEPRHFGALSGLAMCEERLGKDEAALRALERAASVYPSMAGLKQRIKELKRRLEGEPI